MEYTHETLDRATGEILSVSQGNWVTPTELGEYYGVGPRQVRKVLEHMGLMVAEGPHNRMRLAPFAVERGFGKRHDSPKKGHPFDVLSPLGQSVIAEAWDDTVADYEAEDLDAPTALLINDALEAWQAQTGRTLAAQQSVCWVMDHLEAVLVPTRAAIGQALGVTAQLVSHYITKRTEQRQRGEPRKAAYRSGVSFDTLDPDETRNPLAA